MKLVSLRLITADLPRLAAFYERITGLPVKRLSEDFAELRTPAATLAMCSTQTLRFFGPDVARPAENRSTFIEFRVDDVDAVYERIAGLVEGALVQAPTDMPWGNRSLLFRDPDGNLVNVFAPVGSAAR